MARALVVNSGNANAFTGKTGRQSTALTAAIAAKAVGCSPNEVFLASTGVIGEPLDATQIRRRARHAGGDRRARRLDGRRQGDHDHRHLSEGRDRDA